MYYQYVITKSIVIHDRLCEILGSQIETTDGIIQMFATNKCMKVNLEWEP